MPNLIDFIGELSNIKLLGLMCIAPHTDNEEDIRSSFRKMKELKTKYNLSLLSMGMTSDYKIAIEEGTDIVRIGTKIFGKRI